MSRSSGPSRTSATVAKPRKPKPVAADRAEPPPPSGVWREPIPMKPRKRLFVALLIIFGLWVGVLVTMYVTMVRPPHSPHQRPPVTAPALALEVKGTLLS
jgi:hypothetical protein